MPSGGTRRSNERIIQGIDWTFLAGQSGEETLRLLFRFLGRPGLRSDTRQSLKEALRNPAIPVAAGVSIDTRPALMQMLRSEALEVEELDALCERLRERHSWTAEEAFDLLEALPWERVPSRACQLAQALPALSRLHGSRASALWRRLLAHPMEGARRVALGVLLRQEDQRQTLDLIGLESILTLALSDADLLLLDAVVDVVPFDRSISRELVESLAARGESRCL